MDPEQVKDDWQKDEEWTKERMRPLENSLANLHLTSCLSAPTSPLESRKYSTAEISYSEMAASPCNSMEYCGANIRRPNSSLSMPTFQPFGSVESSKIQEEFTQTQAIHILNKMRNGEVSTISRSDIMRLNAMINADNRIFSKVDMLDGVSSYLNNFLYIFFLLRYR